MHLIPPPDFACSSPTTLDALAFHHCLLQRFQDSLPPPLALLFFWPWRGKFNQYYGYEDNTQAGIILVSIIFLLPRKKSIFMYIFQRECRKLLNHGFISFFNFSEHIMETVMISLAYQSVAFLLCCFFFFYSTLGLHTSLSSLTESQCFWRKIFSPSHRES